MVTFAQEQVISAERVQKRYDVSDDTLRRWFRDGLERTKRGRKVYTSLEALDRFFGTAAPAGNTARLNETLSALERMGVNTGRESSTDGKSKRVLATA